MDGEKQRQQALEQSLQPIERQKADLTQQLERINENIGAAKQTEEQERGKLADLTQRKVLKNSRYTS